MKRGDVIGAIAAVVIAAIFIKSGAGRLPAPDPVIRYDPVVVYSEPMLPPLIVKAARVITERAPIVKKALERGPFDRAPVGKQIRVSLTQYCLKGLTRRDNYVREGIVAADPRVFPLARYVEIFIGDRYLGRFLVDDTGKKVKGATLDIWNPSCAAARQFGRQKGSATLVMK